MIALIVAVLAWPGASRAGAQAPTPTPLRIVNQVKTDPKDSGWDKLASIAQAVAAAVALFTAPILLYQLWRSRKDSRDRHALEFNERYTGREFRAVASRVTAFLDVDDAADCVDKLHAWFTAGWAEHQCLPRTPRLPDPDETALPARNDVQQVLGFFEALGTVYNRHDLTSEVILETIATPPVQMFTSGWWFICWRRDGELGAETQLYKQFETLVRDIRTKRTNLGRTRPKDNVRIVCVPREPEDAPYEDWERCARLSYALSERVAARKDGDVPATRTVLDDLLAVVDDVAAHGRRGQPCELTMLVIPRDIEVRVDSWKAVRDKAAHSAHRVSDLGRARLDEVLRRLGAPAA